MGAGAQGRPRAHLATESHVHFSQAPYRALYELILAKHRRPLYWYVIAPRVDANAGERGWLDAFARCSGNPIPKAEVEDLWRLYALGRVNETLLLAFQRGRADGNFWPGPRISLDDYERFADSLG